ncbi:MAG: LysR family transcriptional regulator [Marinosulfonomonas sp.]
MNWEDLKYFLSVARAGQILSASRRLNVSQATLNRRVTALEKSMGVTLFNRTTAGCELTVDGQNLLIRAERVEAETLGMAKDLQSDGHAISGTVRIGAPDGFGVSFLAPRLGRLIDQHPGLTVQLVPVPRSFSLSKREADIAITVGRPKKGLLRAKKLVDYRLGLFASKSYLAEHTAPTHIDALKHHRLVAHVDDLIYSEELEYTAEFWRDWSSTIEISGSLGQLQAVRAGAGIGILHKFMVKHEPDLIELLPDLQVERSYWIVMHESNRDSAKIRAVATFLEAVTVEARRLFE